MKWVINIVLLLLITVGARADLPPRNYPYTLLSASNTYSIRSIPHKLYGPAGKSYVFDANTGEQSYTIDRYFDDQVFLSNDGQYIVQVSIWGWQDQSHSPGFGGYAIAFYHRNKLIKTYEIKDLVKDARNLTYTVSHVLWKYRLNTSSGYDTVQKKFIYPPGDSIREVMDRNSVYLSNDSLYVTTVEQKLYVFNIRNGQIIEQKKAMKFFLKKGSAFTFNNPYKQRIGNVIRFPTEIPPFNDRAETFSTALAELLQLKPARDAYSCDIMVRITFEIDKTGVFKIDDMQALKKIPEQPGPNGDSSFSDSPDLKDKILDWLKGRKFNTEQFPDWIENCFITKEYYFTFH